ncbi:hypothetical protein AQJ46_00080 [Streptomyces canus]|uniref:Uncharacterized protein n=1 Tax=Streptomyces canus TaxID=58343 RepID=A0A101SI32_9ACTN|nr:MULTISPECIES: hypothetical protein [Streptomyces]KUN74042.1 hypothetical protein AQJ46_00080 [Streptomyces canus]MDI5904834.1 hypothetical protein [Streptomyces sp. 12257]
MAAATIVLATVAGAGASPSLIASAITRSTVKGSEQALGVMAGAYARLISARPETLLVQMQGYAVVAAAEAEGDDRTGELVRPAG